MSNKTTTPEAPPAEVVTPSIEVVEAKAIVPGEASVLEHQPVPKEMVVVARNPQQMMVAQARLISWAVNKIAEAKQDHDELCTNYQLAVKNKWRTETLRRHTQKAQKRVEFYEKIKGALEAGYVIVPNMPIDVFAIRTDKWRPKRNEVTGTWSQPSDQTSPLLPAEQGRYVNAEAEVRQSTFVAKHEAGKQPEYGVRKWADDWKDVEFPFQLAKPAIMEATAEAMALRLFDDIAISPSRNAPNMNRSNPRGGFIKGDPMVIGRIILKRDSYNQQAVSFLISWFVDTKDLP